MYKLDHWLMFLPFVQRSQGSLPCRFARISVILPALFLMASLSQTSAADIVLFHGDVTRFRNITDATYDIRVCIFDSPRQGKQLLPPIIEKHTPVVDSRFTIELDLEISPESRQVWLELGFKQTDKEGFFVPPFRTKLNLGSPRRGSEVRPNGCVPLSTARKVGLNEANRRWGKVTAGRIIPCYDGSDSLVAYMCPVRFGAEQFPDYGHIVEEVCDAFKLERRIQEIYREQQTDSTDGQLLTDEDYRKALKAAKLNKLGIGQYGVVYVSARYDRYPIMLCSDYLPPYFTQAGAALKKAAIKAGKSAACLNRYYFLGLRGQAFGIDCEGQMQHYHASSLDVISELPTLTAGDPDANSADFEQQWEAFSAETYPATSGIREALIDEWQIMPCVEWCRGCTPTSTSMVLGYYDRGGLGAEFLGLGRLIDHWQYYSKYVDGREGVMVNVPNILEELRQDMQTDSDGGTSRANMAPGIERTCNVRNGYEFRAEGIECSDLFNAWCWDNITDEIDHSRPFVWSSWPAAGGIGHSVAAFGYRYDTEDSEYKYVIAYNTWQCPGRDEWHYKQFNNNSDIGSAYLTSVLPWGWSWGQTSLCVPNGGEVWAVGSTHDIWWIEDDQRTWSADLDYSADGGDSWKPIATVQPSSPGWKNYSWTIPDDVSEEARVRIRNFSGNSPGWTMQASDGSENDFRIVRRSLHIELPKATSIWYLGQYQSITWDDAAAGDSVKLEMSADGGLTWQTISENTPNDGGYRYQVRGETSDQCIVRVLSVDTPVVLDNSEMFVLRQPSITLDEPQADTVWTPGRTGTIVWSSEGLPFHAPVDIDLSRDGGSSWEAISKNAEDDGWYFWNVTGPGSNNCRVRVRSSDDLTVSAENDSDFVIEAPSITVITPSKAEVLRPGQLYEITWTTAGISSSMDIYKSLDGGETWSYLTRSGNGGAYLWEVDGQSEKDCFIRIESSLDPAFAGTSDPFRIEASMKILHPREGQTCYIGDVETIRWLAGGIDRHVSIEVKQALRTDWVQIASEVPNNGQYPWTVSGDPATYQVRITSVEEPSEVTVSEEFPVEHWQILSPNGGEIWNAGETYPIEWPGSNLARTVRIELSHDDGTTWNTLASGAPCTGRYDWAIADYGPENLQSRVRLTLEQAETACVDQSDGTFELAAPFVRVISPRGGDTVFAGEKCRIIWDSRGVGKSVRIELLRDRDAGEWQTIVGNALNDGLYFWDVTGPAAERCNIRVTSNDWPRYSGISGDGIESFSVVERPSLWMIWPDGGEDLHMGGDCNITWDSFGSGDNVKIELTRDDGTTWEVLADSTENDGSYLWTVDGLLSGECRIRVTSLEDTSMSAASKGLCNIGEPGGSLYSTGLGYTAGGGAAIYGPQNMIQRFDADQAIQFIPQGSDYELSVIKMAMKGPIISSWNNILDVSLMDDNGDTPGNVLASTTLEVPEESGWIEAPLGFHLTEGTPYWIMCSIGGNGNITWHFADPPVAGMLMNRKNMGEWKYWDYIDHYADSSVAMILEGRPAPVTPKDPDITGDRTIDVRDFTRLSSYWMHSDCSDMLNRWCGGADLDRSGKVDSRDLQILAERWLELVAED